ncbi:universal stress protein [Streptosporangium sp. NPDC006007]|uniref:universal stress protein n=1 Tax=Streptosporangium sp. NPDC006007 TaxID=3154575 RepID=UPI0033A7A7EA
MTRPIVVGVDGSTPSLRAVSWAGQEAALRDVPLRIVHAALRWAYHVPLVPQPAHWGAEAEAAAQDMLRQAVIHARAGRPRLEVTTEIVDGGASEALVTAAEEAQLLVVGDRGRGGFAELLLGSVSRYVTARASCPVAVVRRSHDDYGEVVVGVTGEPDQDAVLDLAFREAALRHAALRAVHAWRHPTTRAPGDMQPLVYDVKDVGEEEARLLSEALAGWREKFPDVMLIQSVVHEHPAKALIEASADADLVVIGAHSRTRSPLGLGATAHAVLHHSSAPVIVLGHPRVHRW